MRDETLKMKEYTQLNKELEVPPSTYLPLFRIWTMVILGSPQEREHREITIKWWKTLKRGRPSRVIPQNLSIITVSAPINLPSHNFSIISLWGMMREVRINTSLRNPQINLVIWEIRLKGGDCWLVGLRPLRILRLIIRMLISVLRIKLRKYCLLLTT